MFVSEALALGIKRLRQVGIDEAQIESEHMLMHLLGQNRAGVYLRKQDALKSEQEKQFFIWIERREKRVPLAYLLGDVFFHSLKLKVRPGCLIPRPETERLVDEAIQLLRKDQIQSPVIMDVGTGSGAIALAILAAFPDAKAVMVDISADALEIARENAKELGFLNRVELAHSDLFTDILSDLRFDLILSNPPYLTAEDMSCLQPEVAFEPRAALNGGKDGLDFYRKMIPDAAKFLKPQGWLGFEVGAGQAISVSEELKRNGYEDLKIFKDHQDIERTVFARKSY